MKQINRYIDSVFCGQDTLLDEVIASIKENEMPPISVSPSSGKLFDDVSFYFWSERYFRNRCIRWV